MSKTVGLIGLGAIGHPLAANLVGAGLRVLGYRRGDMSAFTALGGEAAASPRAMAEAAEVVITVLPDAAAVRSVMEGPDGLLAAGRQGLVIVELSTLAISDKEALRDLAAGAGAVLLDSPLSGVPSMVENRAAIIFASGEKSAWDAHEAVFRGMSDKAFFLGEFGVGTKMKFVANALVGVHILAAAEAMALGVKAGLDPELMVKVLSPSAGTSLQFQVRSPLMAERRYAPVMAPHTVLAKDLKAIAAFADEIGCPSPLTHTAERFFARALEEGRGGEDVASVFELVRKDCGLEG